ncbi:MAG: GAF domain-containing SpoIIE family protein phosphatase [Bryobacteraceae bacterium]
MNLRSRAVYFLLFVYIAISLTYQIVASVSFIVGYFNLRHQVRAPFGVDSERPAITSVTKEAKRAGLAAGDTIESLNGAPYNGEALWRATRWYAHPGDVLRVGIRRANGTRATVFVPLVPEAPNNAPIGQTVFVIFLQIVVPFFCLGLGYWVAAMRPKDPNAWLILILLSYPESFISVSTYNWWPGIWLVLRLDWHLVLEFLGPVALVWLGLLFPERSRIDIRLPWLKWLMLGLLVCGLGAGLATDYSEWYDMSLIPNAGVIDAVNNRISLWIMLSCVILYWIAIFEKYFTISAPDARRRVRVLCAGSVVGHGSLLIIFGLLPWFGIADPGSIQWLGYLSAILMLFFPLSLAYVVIVQRAMDVSLVIRQGLQYTLARRGVLVLRLLLSAALFIVVASLVTTHALSPMWTIAILAAGIWGIFLLHGLAQRAAIWIDRRFFRDSYNAERMLSELAEQVRTIVETQPLLETVTRRIADALHVPRIAVLLNGNTPYQPACAIGYGSLPNVMFPERAATVELLKKEKQPVRVYFDDPEAWIYRLPEMSAGEREKLAELQSELLLPLVAKEELIGFMSLSQKLAEAPYSGTDLRLLNSVAAQTSMALEVSRLTAAVARETGQRERQDRELEIAREVQQRLFPQCMPAIQGLSMCGVCRPAQGVGGDYYDMIELGGERLGIAIGDVSGKGISAALLMASLRACLRTMTLVGSLDLAALMQKMNQLVYEWSAANRYATFFFAIYDSPARKLQYVNAGHNPPFLMRRTAGGTIEHIFLEAGGPVIGLLPNVPYEEQSLTLETGDVLFAYTDGISEAMTESDEEWGEERMRLAAETAASLSAEDILGAVFAAADQFTGSAPQYDDMTVLVLKVT